MKYKDFPASRIHLWNSEPIGTPVLSSLLSSSVNGVVISEHVLQRTSKLQSSNNSSFDCFLLGTVRVSNNKVFIDVDRIDLGKEIISDADRIIKVPTSILPGDMIIPTKILQEEDTITFTTEHYCTAFTELQNKLHRQCDFGNILQIKCILCVMPVDDLGTPLKITLEMVHPDSQFALQSVPSLPLASTPVTRALSSDLANSTKYGYVTLDAARRGVLLVQSDKSIADTILVGVWVSLPLSHPINSDSTHPLGPGIWLLLLSYIFQQGIVRESALPGTFLLCVVSGGTVLTWECTIKPNTAPFKQLKCTKYVVVADTQISDTTTFHLTGVDVQTDSYKMFSAALSTLHTPIWDAMVAKPETCDIEPRDVPMLTPTGKTRKPQPTPPSHRPRPISPLSIIVPSNPTSTVLENGGEVESSGANNKTPVSNNRTGTVNSDVTPATGSRTHSHLTPARTATHHTPTATHHTPTENKEETAAKADPAQDSAPPAFHHIPGYMYPPQARYPDAQYNPDIFSGSSSHSRQGSDPHLGPTSPISPYFFNPYVDPRYQYPPYNPYHHPLFHGMPPNGPPHVPAFYPPEYSPHRWKNKRSPRERSAFRRFGRTSPNKRTNHRSPDKSSFSSLNKSVCSTSTISSHDSANNSSRSRSRNKRKPADKETVPEPARHGPRSLKSSTSSCVSEKYRANCTRDTPDRSNGSRSSRTTSSQSETASISAKALKMLTLQKRQLDHLQQQVSLLMKNVHASPPQMNNVVSLDKSIENMREQMHILEQEIDQGGVRNADKTDMCVGTGQSLILTQNTATNMTESEAREERSVQCDSIHSETREHSVQCSESGTEATAPSFYLKYKENCDPACSYSDTSDNYTRYSGVSGLQKDSFSGLSGGPKDSYSPKYHDHSIFQHPKIQHPTIYHSINNSFLEQAPDQANSPTFSLATQKYLEKHQLVSPPTRDGVSASKSRAGRLVNGKTLHVRNSNDRVLHDFHRLQLK